MEFDKSKLTWLEFNLLKSFPLLSHGTFERNGGTSHDPYRSLNFANDIGDHPDCVKLNRDIVKKALDLESLTFPHQTHSTQIACITAKNKSEIHQADALFTKEKNIGLGVTHADCQGAIFYDPVQQVIAVAHAGWRGSAQNIYAEVVQVLELEAGTNPSDLIVCISPSIGPDHAEFKNYKQELPESFWSFQTTPNHFDFWKISESQLLSSGVLKKNIEIACQCTACSLDNYFSYRKEKTTGRNATIVALKEG